MNEDGEIFLGDHRGRGAVDDRLTITGTRARGRSPSSAMPAKTPTPVRPAKGTSAEQSGRHRSVALAGSVTRDRRHGPGVVAAGALVAPPVEVGPPPTGPIGQVRRVFGPSQQQL